MQNAQCKMQNGEGSKKKCTTDVLHCAFCIVNYLRLAFNVNALGLSAGGFTGDRQGLTISAEFVGLGRSDVAIRGWENRCDNHLVSGLLCLGLDRHRAVLSLPFGADFLAVEGIRLVAAAAAHTTASAATTAAR